MFAYSKWFALLIRIKNAASSVLMFTLVTKYFDEEEIFISHFSGKKNFSFIITNRKALIMQLNVAMYVFGRKTTCIVSIPQIENDILFRKYLRNNEKSVILRRCMKVF